MADRKIKQRIDEMERLLADAREELSAGRYGSAEMELADLVRESAKALAEVEALADADREKKR